MTRRYPTLIIWDGGCMRNEYWQGSFLSSGWVTENYISPKKELPGTDPDILLARETSPNTEWTDGHQHEGWPWFHSVVLGSNYYRPQKNGTPASRLGGVPSVKLSMKISRARILAADSWAISFVADYIEKWIVNMWSYPGVSHALYDVRVGTISDL